MSRLQSLFLAGVPPIGGVPQHDRDPVLHVDGAVGAEGLDPPDRRPGDALQLPHAEVLQLGTGGGEGEEPGLPHPGAAPEGDLAEGGQGASQGDEATVGHRALAQVQRPKSLAGGAQAGQAAGTC